MQRDVSPTICVTLWRVLSGLLKANCHSHCDMGAKQVRSLSDFGRYGFDIEVRCRNGHCNHAGVISSHDVCRWFFIHRWPTHLEGFIGSPHDRFRCTKCGDKAGSFKGTDRPVTVVDFFPATELGWKMVIKRLRG